ALQTDGKLIVSGSFTNLAGQPRTNLARLEATSPATRSLSRVGSDITWLRGGTSPEVWRTVFDGSTNGMDWTPLGAGNPTAGGWQLTNVLALANATIRARGFTTSGQGNNSGGVVKDSYGPPLLLVQPFSQTNNAGDVAGFEVRAIGSEPITLCWLKDGALLTNGSKFAGSETPALSVTNIQKSDEGGYSIVLSNSFGSVTSIVATLTVLDPGIATQPASQNREPGQETTFTVTPAGAAPFAFQWLKDGVALPDATNSALLLTNLLVSDAGHYTVVVSNSLGSITSAPAQLTVNGVAVDTGFDAGDGNNQVYAVVAQPDGKLLVGGGYTRIGGQPLNAFARLNADGSADTDFNPGFVGTTLSSIAYLPDRSMLLGGGFSSLGGAARHDIGRLTPDATADSSFTNSPTGWLSSLAVQADDTVFVGGYFTAFGGQPHTNLARLSADGSVDGSFNPAANDIAYAFVTLPDKRILVGGWFTMVNGQPRTNLARLNVDGSLDPTFTLDAASEEWSSLVFALTPQTDGKILVGGVFSTLGGMAHEYLARLNADGSLDDGFTAGVRHSNPWLRPSVNSIVVQCDGKILIGGVFTHVNGQPRANIARLNADGSLDLTFNPGGG
ncbi:MAG TPA: hypothetical protein VK327_08795, partial [Candidatus Paceibacterota bacterium]|nr:hypothetical protein [Candidatus Paceibacterota bacterium]